MELKCLSGWRDRLRGLVADRVSGLGGRFGSPGCGVFGWPGIGGALRGLRAGCVLVPVGRAASGVIVVCGGAVLAP